MGRTSETLGNALAERLAENNGATAPWGLMYSECMDWDPFVSTARAMKGRISQGLPLLIVKKLNTSNNLCISLGVHEQWECVDGCVRQ